MSNKEIKYYDDDDDHNDIRGLIPLLVSGAKNAILKPIRPFVSRTALKTYLTTLLATLAAFTLFGLAITAYILFYISYIPRVGFERTIHLQFDNVYAPHTNLARHAHPYPYGSATLAPDLVAQQGYDVWVELSLPRTEENQDAGNFMLSVEMFAPDLKGKKGGAGAPTNGNIIAPLRADVGSIWPNADTSTVLATSRRSAILPYRSWWVDLVYKLTELHWYLLGFRSEETKLRIPIFERITFPRGAKNIPSVLKLEIQSSHRLQIYSAKALFRARFQGLRWLMYNHRIISAILFISTFWFTELVFAGLAWAAMSLLLAKGNQLKQDIKADDLHEAATHIKREEGEGEDAQPVLSDTERTFPTLSGQPPLRYTSPLRDVKIEPVEDGGGADPLSERLSKGVEADVEDEDEDEDEDVDFRDSGIGTSLESSGPARRESLRRRRGRIGARTLTPGSSGSSTLHGGGEEE